MAGIEKDESILLIQHAINAYHSENRTQQELAKFLCIETSRLSEGKKGNWRLMPSQKKRIIDEFGYPKQGKGTYVKAEHYSTVNQFIDSYFDTEEQRFYQRLSNALGCDNYQMKFLDCVLLKDCSNDHNSNELKLSILNDYINSNEFYDWFNIAKNDDSVYNNLTTLSSWNRYGLKSCSRYDYEFMSSYLYKVGMLKFCHNSSYIIGGEQNKNVVEKEFVLSGNMVLDEHVFIGENKRLKSSISIPKRYEGTLKHLGEIDLFPDSWDKVKLKMFLSDSMRYNLLIILIPSDVSLSYLINKRMIIIEDLNLIEDINMLREFFDIPSFESSIKYKIAKNGGYVSGARRL